MTRDTISATFDGSCWPNPHGKAGYGFVVYRNGIRIHDESGEVGNGYGMTNNVAEAEGLCRLIDYLISEKLPPNSKINIAGDSRVVINVARGKRNNPQGYFASRAMEARAKFNTLKASCPHATLAWISRAENSEADELSRPEGVNYEEDRMRSMRQRRSS